MGRVSSKLADVKPSATLVIAGKAKQMCREGKDVVSFSTGEPDFPSPESVKRAGIAAIMENFTRYTESDGIPELRQAIVEKLRRDNGIEADAGHVLVSSGGKHSIYNALLAITDPDDEIVIAAPYWTSYPEMVRLVGGKPVIVPTKPENRYKLTPEELRSAITDRTKGMFLNTPSNPTGVMYAPEEIEALVAVAVEAGIFVISDELYEKMVYGSVPHWSPGAKPEFRNHVITINGVSKAYAMTGWRIGFMTGPADVMEAAARIQSQSTSNACSISQRAALAAMLNAGEDSIRMRDAFWKRRDIVIELLSAIPDLRFPLPDGAFYIFFDVSAYLGDRFPTGDDIARYLLEEHLVATIPGSAFGDDNAIRLSYACSENDIRRGIERIAEGLRQAR